MSRASRTLPDLDAGKIAGEPELEAGARSRGSFRDLREPQPWPEPREIPEHGPNWALVFAFFLVLAIVQTWPLALHMTDRAIGWPGDAYVMWWNLTWVKDSLIGLSNPFQTDVLYYPQGQDLYLHTLIPLDGLATAPLLLITDNVLFSWNVVMLVFLALSGTGGYALSYHVTKDRWASLFGGFVFAFSPHVMMQLHGHLNIATTWPIPFFILALVRSFEERRRRDVIIAGLLAAVLTWNWLEFAIDVALFSVLLFAFWSALALRAGRRSEILPMVRRLLPGVAIWLVLSLPLIVPTMTAINSGDYTVRVQPNEADNYAPDLVAYFIPSPLWGPGQYSNNFGEKFSPRSGGIETTMFLGFTPLVLSTIALAWRKRTGFPATVWFWSIVFAFFAALALGPTLHAFGVSVPGPMPFRALQEVPLISERRVPGRMIIVGALAMGVLGSAGISLLAQRYGRSMRNAAPVFACIAVAVVGFEYWNAPVSLAQYNVPPIYEQISQDDAEFAVLDLPLGRLSGNIQRGDFQGGAMSDYAQLTHGHASIGGYLSRVTDDNLDWLEETPGIGYLQCLDCDDYPRPQDLDAPRVRALFTEELRVKYVVVNLVTFEGKDTTLITDGTAAEAQLYLEETLGYEKIAEGDGWLAYRNPGFRD